jgi:hypothetical protein
MTACISAKAMAALKSRAERAARPALTAASITAKDVEK